MTMRERREFNEWRTKAEKYKKELDELIFEKFSAIETEQKEGKELKKLISDTGLAKEGALTKQKELDELINKELQKEKTTKGQKMLLLQLLGTLDSVDHLKISQGNKIKLLSYIVAADEKNIEKDFNSRNLNLRSTLSIKANYTFLENISKVLRLKEYEKVAEDMLRKIENKSNKVVTPKPTP